jgi:membrane-associated protein
MMTLLDWVKSLHNPETFALWLSQSGLLIITLIIFAETGLFFGFFLPGDSLIITAGVFANPANPNPIAGLDIRMFALVLTITAILGDQLGYFLGRKTGEIIFERKDGVLFKKKYLHQAKAFYDQYGIAAIIACRFVPILRTFVPFVAGVARMNYNRYLKWDILGGFVWINSMLAIGYFLGQTAFANRLDKVIVLVVFVSVIPMLIGILRKIVSKEKTHGSV